MALGNSHDRIRTLAPYLLFGVVAAIHFVYLMIYSVDLPHWDEWGMVAGVLQTVSGQPAWLGMLHNEHFILPTKLSILALYFLNGWNITFNLAVNYLGFMALLGVFPSFARRTGDKYPAFLFFFLVFLLSPRNFESHYLPAQSCAHFFLGFSLAATACLFGERQTWATTALGACCLVMSCLSLASGAAASAAILLVFTVFKLRRAEFAQLAVAWVIGGAGLVYFFQALKSAGIASGVLSSVLSGAVWAYWLSLISFPFGVGSLAWALGLFCLLLVLVPFALQYHRLSAARGGAEWRVLALTVGVLAALGSVALGRASFPESARSSRYFEFGMYLLPACVVAWSWVLETQVKRRRQVLVGLWGLALISFWNEWHFDIYRQLYEVRQESIVCVRRYFETGVREVCPTTAPVWIDFEQSRRLGLSFVKKLGY